MIHFCDSHVQRLMKTHQKDVFKDLPPSHWKEDKRDVGGVVTNETPTSDR